MRLMRSTQRGLYQKRVGKVTEMQTRVAVICRCGTFYLIEQSPVCPNCQKNLSASKAQTPTIIVDNFKPDHYWSFGKVINSKRELHEEIRRTNGEKGMDLVEVGNDSMHSIKKQNREY